MPGLRERDTNAAIAVAAAKRPSLEEMAPRAGGQAGAVAHAAAKAHAAGGVEQLRMQWGAGAFRHVHLENFMCHEHFEVRTQRRASERASERETERDREPPALASPGRRCAQSARRPVGRPPDVASVSAVALGPRVVGASALRSAPLPNWRALLR